VDKIAHNAECMHQRRKSATPKVNSPCPVIPGNSGASCAMTAGFP
jgi:hypothetical protein